MTLSISFEKIRLYQDLHVQYHLPRIQKMVLVYIHTNPILLARDRPLSFLLQKDGRSHRRSIRDSDGTTLRPELTPDQAEIYDGDRLFLD